MRWKNVRLILAREIRDQLRDRRTLFMVVVLPLLLYPLLALSILQVSQFIQDRPTTVWVIGARNLDGLPALVDGDRFAGSLFDGLSDARLLELHFDLEQPERGGPEPDRVAEARRRVESGEYDAALCFPPDFADRLDVLRRQLAGEMPRAAASREQDGPSATPATAAMTEVPEPIIVYSRARERSLIAFARLHGVLRRWIERVGDDNLAVGGLPARAAKPFSLETVNVAEDNAMLGAATWAKILPMLLVLWAMTGAFYPAVDLCAGEKERGTLEALLSSPALRGEIVVGKLLTVMLFSALTAALNLLALGLTGYAALGRLPGFSLPSPVAAVWLGLALAPMAALFGALSLALAAFARSTKEAQYYLMPLMMLTMPLVLLPQSPGVELSLGTSLIPISGVVLLLRSAMEGGFAPALRLAPVVACVTLGSCVLAVRWAIEQFNSESVLFRESERLDARLWLRHAWRQRQSTPGVAAAAGCAAVILLARFYIGTTLSPPRGLASMVGATAFVQLVVIALPAVAMTFLLARSATKTLQLRRPAWPAVPAAMLLAVLLHPLVATAQRAVVALYPPGEAAAAWLGQWQEWIGAATLWQKVAFVFVLSLVPAVCEELAFRGFILSGFRRLGSKWRAIGYSALVFGFAHGVLQQSLVASLVGVVIGYLVIQSGSILPGMAYHAVHNAIPLATVLVGGEWVERLASARMVVERQAGEYAFTPWVVVASALAAAYVLRWFARQDYARTPEELRHEALHHRRPEAVLVE